MSCGLEEGESGGKKISYEVRLVFQGIEGDGLKQSSGYGSVKEGWR